MQTSAVQHYQENGLTIVTFPPSWLSIFAAPKGGGEYRPVRLHEAMQDSRVFAALDGPMFSNCDPSSRDSYERSSCADPHYGQIAAAFSDEPNAGRSDAGVTLSVRGETALWSQGWRPAPGAGAAVQLYPSLVINGVVSRLSASGGNASRVWRAGVLGMPNGKLGFAVAVDTLAGFAARCGATGAMWGGYTDGGGSGALGFRRDDSVIRTGSATDRPVASFLVALAPHAPREEPHAASAESAGGTSPAVAAFVAGIAILGAWWLWPTG